MDSSGVVENSFFSDNDCGISVNSSGGITIAGYGGCYGIHTTGQTLSSSALQIKNNQFIRNKNIGIEFRSGTAPAADNNIFTDNGYPMKIESSYPAITNSQLTNSTTSPNIINGIAISGFTHFSQNYTLKKDLPYILETSGPNYSAYVDSGVTLTIEPGVILKGNSDNSTIYINGSLTSNGTLAEPVIFTSFKDDAKGGDTNGDGAASTPQINDWSRISFSAGSVGNLTNTNFYYGTADPAVFPYNQNLPATSLISQCLEGGQPAEYSFDAGSKIAFGLTSLSDVARGQIAFSLRKASSTPGSLRVSVEENAGGHPSGNYVSTMEIIQATLDFNFKDYKLLFGVGIGSSPGLIANAVYWATIENINGPSDQFYIKNTGGDTCPITPQFKSSPAGVWNEASPADIVFKAEKIEYYLPVLVDTAATVVVE